MGNPSSSSSSSSDFPPPVQRPVLSMSHELGQPALTRFHPTDHHHYQPGMGALSGGWSGSVCRIDVYYIIIGILERRCHRRTGWVGLVKLGHSVEGFLGIIDCIVSAGFVCGVTNRSDLVKQIKSISRGVHVQNTGPFLKPPTFHIFRPQTAPSVSFFFHLSPR